MKYLGIALILLFAPTVKATEESQDETPEDSNIVVDLVRGIDVNTCLEAELSCLGCAKDTGDSSTDLVTISKRMNGVTFAYMPGSMENPGQPTFHQFTVSIDPDDCN